MSGLSGLSGTSSRSRLVRGDDKLISVFNVNIRKRIWMYKVSLLGRIIYSTHAFRCRKAWLALIILTLLAWPGLLTARARQNRHSVIIRITRDLDSVSYRLAVDVNAALDPQPSKVTKYRVSLNNWLILTAKYYAFTEVSSIPRMKQCLGFL